MRKFRYFENVSFSEKQSESQLLYESSKFRITSYKTTLPKKLLYYFLSCITLGLLPLIGGWFPKVYSNLSGIECNQDEADFILIRDAHQRFDVCWIEKSHNEILIKPDGSTIHLKHKLSFVYRKMRYNWIDGNWVPIKSTFEQMRIAKLINAEGLTTEQANARRQFFGENLMSAQLTPIAEIVLKEVLTPFYLFQAFSVIVWYFDDYVWYAMLIVIMSSYSILITLQQTRQQEKRIRAMVVEHADVEVKRGSDKFTRIDSTMLVPGDVIRLVGDSQLYSDCVLISGTAIVNESMLTGESIPVTKTPVEDGGQERFDVKKLGRHMLFNGTTVVQTKSNEPVLAMVVRTGYSTSKGELIRSIMYPKPSDFQFINQLMKFVGVLAIVATAGFIYTSAILYYRGSTFSKMLIRALDLVTITVPPALPAVMSIGIYYAMKRLKKHSIFCTSPSTINTCGAINVMCFDKTGTLTEDGLNYHACRLVMDDGNLGEEVQHLPMEHPIVSAMATCHSLAKINGQIQGDPLDKILFEQTGLELNEQPNIRQFAFSSTLQRMSIVIRKNEHNRIVSKGSPEIIASLAHSIPPNFQKLVDEYSTHGYRLIAIADRHTTHAPQTREEAERDLTILGLIALENRLKPITQSVISELNAANIRSIMITGDNLLTAVSVAEQCGIGKDVEIIRHEDVKGMCRIFVQSKSGQHELNRIYSVSRRFAISGSTLSIISRQHSTILEQVVLSCVVFARMSPDQKQQVIEILATHGNTVGMCGDGANDCAALKAAHAGISLSDAEASIAAPFTSKVCDIRCVLRLIQEGRAALATSFSAFLYMSAYSLTQFVSILLLYWIAISYSQMQFLIIDMPIVTVLAWLSSRTSAYHRLDESKPKIAILSLSTMLALFGQLLISAISQVFIFHLVTKQDWFIPYVATKQDHEYDRRSQQSTAIFYTSIFSYITMNVIFSKGEPFRKSIRTNRPYLLAIIFLTLLSILLVTVDFVPIRNVLGCVHIPFDFRLIILATASVTAVASFLFDAFVASPF